MLEEVDRVEERDVYLANASLSVYILSRYNTVKPSLVWMSRFCCNDCRIKVADVDDNSIVTPCLCDAFSIDSFSTFPSL